MPQKWKADTHKRKTAAGTHPTAALTDFPKTNFSFSLKQLNLKTIFFKQLNLKTNFFFLKQLNLQPEFLFPKSN